MAFLLGLLGKLGLGGLVSWISGGVFSSLAGLIVAAATQLFEAIGIVLKWAVKTFIEGIDHIIKSVPAILVVLSLSWASWGYATYVKPAQVRVIKERVEVPAVGAPKRREKTLVEEIFGGL